VDLRYTYTRLLVSDFPACFRFYRDVLGLTPSFGEEEGTYADFDAGSIAIALFARQEMADAVGAGNLAVRSDAQDRVALIFNVDDVDAVSAELASRGVDFVNQPRDRRDWGGRVAHFRDPDGTLIELFQSIPMSSAEGES
jgi:catechol 2,3-dioxygenase-like lactoylglutathione lyase family enzyme